MMRGAWKPSGKIGQLHNWTESSATYRSAVKWPSRRVTYRVILPDGVRSSKTRESVAR